MDISNNTTELNEMMYYYQRNMRDYMENIHEYNNNVNMFFNILSRSTNTPSSASSRVHAPAPRFTVPNQNQENPVYYTPFRTNLHARGEPNLIRTPFEDVVIRPTSTQLSRALYTYYYESTNEEPPICPITLEPIQDGEEVTRIRSCGHLFKRNAIQGWFDTNVRCPVCRFDIRNHSMDVSGIPQIPTAPAQVQSRYEEDESTEFDDVVQEFAEEGRAFIRNRINPLTDLFGVGVGVGGSDTQIPLTTTLTNAIRTFMNNELQRLPVNDATTELLYTFDLPLRLDASGNYTL